MEYLVRDPSSFTPTLESSQYGGKSLLLGSCTSDNHRSISQFSSHDADAYETYDNLLGQCREMVTPLLDSPLPLDREVINWQFWKNTMNAAVANRYVKLWAYDHTI